MSGLVEKRRPFLGVRGAADYLSLSTHTIYQYAETGVLPCYKLGNRLRFDPNQLDQWLAERHVPAIRSNTATTAAVS